MAETFSLFGLQGYLYGLCAFIGAVILLAGMQLTDRKLPHGTVSLFGVLGIVLGIVFARAFFCAVNWSEFVHNYENPMLMLNWFDGGMSMTGLLLGLLLAAMLTARIRRISFGRLMDAVCVPFGLMIAALRFGEQFTDLGVGAAVNEGFATEKLSWLLLESRMGVMVEYRLNVWLYEVVAGVILFLAAVCFFRKLKSHAGDTALLVVSLWGASQILLESMRDDGHMLVIFLRIGQLSAFLLPAVSCGILCRRSLRSAFVSDFLYLNTHYSGFHLCLLQKRLALFFCFRLNGLYVFKILLGGCLRRFHYPVYRYDRFRKVSRFGDFQSAFRQLCFCFLQLSLQLFILFGLYQKQLQKLASVKFFQFLFIHQTASSAGF